MKRKKPPDMSAVASMNQQNRVQRFKEHLLEQLRCMPGTERSRAEREHELLIELDDLLGDKKPD